MDKLGVKLYDRVSAVLAELIANCYDADAESVIVTAPMDTLLAEKKGGTIKDKGLEIVVEDDGCGMSPEEVNPFYLRVGAERRADPKRGDVSRKFKRKVMGRKGVGKLAPFGVCKIVEIISAGGPVVDGVDAKGRSAKGHRVAHFTLEMEKIQQDTDSDYQPPPGPLDGTVQKRSGTKVILRDFNHRRVPDMPELSRQLAARFGVQSSNWQITLRDSNKKPSQKGYMTVVGDLDVDTMPASLLRLEDPKPKKGIVLGPINLPDGKPHDKLRAGFEHEGKAYPVTGWIGYAKVPYKDEVMAGVRIYCRDKIAAQTPVFNLKAGFTGEHSVRSYLVGELHADWLDEEEDLIRTDRQDILWSGDLGRAFEAWGQAVVKVVGTLTLEPMRKNMWERFLDASKFDERVLEEYPATDLKDVRDNCVEVARLIAKSARGDELNDPEHVESLVQLSLLFGPHLTVDQQLEKAAEGAGHPIAVISRLLRTARIAELSSFGGIAAKRVDVIERLEHHKDDAATIEAVLQDLLESAPWLINPQWSPITANQTFETFREEFKKFYKKREKKDLTLKPVRDSNKRADFVMSSQDNAIQIIEIKRPGHTLTDAEFARLVKYDELMSEFLSLKGNQDYQRAFPNYRLTLVCDDLAIDHKNTRAMEALVAKGLLEHINWKTFLLRARRCNEDFLEEAKRQKRWTSKSRKKSGL
ncbi:ATP-binding protein [Leptolyngbya sp. 15MV]|nr:ATP-binding protein [Leptolyngbya sp. 15MV]